MGVVTVIKYGNDSASLHRLINKNKLFQSNCQLPIRVSSNSSEDGPGIASVPTLTSLTNGMNTWLDSSSELKLKKQERI